MLSTTPLLLSAMSTLALEGAHECFGDTADIPAIEISCNKTWFARTSPRSSGGIQESNTRLSGAQRSSQEINCWSLSLSSRGTRSRLRCQRRIIARLMLVAALALLLRLVTCRSCGRLRTRHPAAPAHSSLLLRRSCRPQLHQPNYNRKRTTRQMLRRSCITKQLVSARMALVVRPPQATRWHE
eukprot:COSAG01_NODE_2023_length_8616_cov_89.751673_6_plen_184_part_00